MVASPPAGAQLRLPALDLSPAAQLPAELAGAAARIRTEAERALRHEFDLLGSGPVQLGNEIDWHRDFKSGYRWPGVFFQDVEVSRLGDASDAKVPWELSRCHHLLALARAAVLFQDERYADELEAQLISWIESNPAGVGINWTNPMEVALRAASWVWALATLEAWRPLGGSARKTLTRSLQVHGRHIALNLEGTPYLRSNHFLADLLGMLVLGSVLERDPAASRWWRTSRRRLEREILRQVHPDGVGFEASLAYHGLALEIFLVSWWVTAQAGCRFSRRYEDRIRRMLDVSAAVRHPDGSIPAFGDADDGRVLPASRSRGTAHDHLLSAGTALLGPGGGHRFELSDEVAWNFGLAAWERARDRGQIREVEASTRERSVAFQDGGVYVLDGGGAHAVARCGDVGQNGNGGHAHNDLLSYELSYGSPIVVDSGTYVYTADPRARNRFRSTAAHNTVVVDGEEINPIAADQLFRLKQVARPQVHMWKSGTEITRLVASHDGYRRLPQKAIHLRALELDTRCGVLVVQDRVLGEGTVRANCFVHLAQNVRVARVRERIVELEFDGGSLWVEFSGALDAIVVSEGWISPAYGVRVRAPVIEATAEGRLPLAFAHRFLPRS